MAEYIDREAVYEVIEEDGKRIGMTVCNRINCKELIRRVPAADVAEVKHGEWIMRGGWFRCSVCDERALLRDVGGTGGFSHEYHQVKTNLCPTCGAKMDGKENAE